MTKHLLISALVLVASIGITRAHHTAPANENSQDSIRIAELDRYYAELSRTVREGDVEGYKAGYHEDAVVIFASGTNKTSMPISSAIAGWKQGFLDTKEERANSDVQFRFSQRIGNETTAHETGIFYYTTGAAGSAPVAYITHFEMLLVKRDGIWIAMMEYQKADATPEEWEALK